MNLQQKTLVALLAVILCGCAKPPRIVQAVSSSASGQWVDVLPEKAKGVAAKSATVVIDTARKLQRIEGFGACFNELGWRALSALDTQQRDEVISELFAPDGGCRFTVCRMPVGANDFSRGWYSYCEKAGDLAMESFSIDNDRETLIPFIKSALAQNPSLSIWASPWCPPSWMKVNGHYACRPHPVKNDLPGDPKTNTEGRDMFITRPEYLKAYALYFGKFIDAYRDEGIRIFAVAPQNEFNSCQVFPSCTWTSRSLAAFIGGYLGKEMASRGVEIILGTMERENRLLIDTVMTDPAAGPYISRAGFQWRGKGAITAVHEKYPQLRLMQTESECGDGRNTWEFCMHTWDLVKHYLRNGASVYEYWNIALAGEGNSRWGWRQNSLVTVDSVGRSFRYNPEFYLMKHLSHFVAPGAALLDTPAEQDMLAFLNPDGSVAVVAVNREAAAAEFNFATPGRAWSVPLSAGSINTILIEE